MLAVGLQVFLPCHPRHRKPHAHKHGGKGSQVCSWRKTVGLQKQAVGDSKGLAAQVGRLTGKLIWKLCRMDYKGSPGGREAGRRPLLVGRWGSLPQALCPPPARPPFCRVLLILHLLPLRGPPHASTASWRRKEVLAVHCSSRPSTETSGGQAHA